MRKRAVVPVFLALVGALLLVAFIGSCYFRNSRSDASSAPAESPPVTDTSSSDDFTSYFFEKETILNEIKDMVLENEIGFQIIITDSQYSVYSSNENKIVASDVKNFNSILENIKLLKASQTFFDPSPAFFELNLISHNPIGESFIYSEEAPTENSIGIWTHLKDNWYYVQYLHV